MVTSPWGNLRRGFANHESVTWSQGLCPSLLVGMTVPPFRPEEGVKGLETFISNMRSLGVNLCRGRSRYRPERGESIRLQQFLWARE